MADKDFDVIVVGGGPSGLTVAAELAIAGVRVMVIERRTGVVESRAGTLLPRVLELFDSRGIADRFIRKAKELQKWPFTPGHIWSGLKPVEWRHYASRFGFTLIVPQNYTEEVLMNWGKEVGVELLFGHQVVDLSVSDDGVSVDVASGDSTKKFTAQYLVGADGGRSTVRTKLGIPFEGTSPTFTGLLGDLNIDFPFPGTMKSVDSENGWALALHFGKGKTRIGMVHAQRRHASKDEPVTVEEYTQCLRDIFGSDFGVKELEWSSRFTDQLRIVPSFGQGRAFLVGEACRLHYPSSGVGMNFCIQDAFNLGWKLAYVLKGQAAPEILDTYNTERRPVAVDLLENVRTQCAFQFEFSKNGVEMRRRFERDYLPLPDFNRRLGLELNGVSFPYPVEEQAHPLAGWNVPDIDLIVDDGTVSRLGTLMRRQRFVLLDLSGSYAFADLKFGDAPVDVVQAQGVNLPTNMQSVKALLVRPDSYVAWATDSVPTAEDACKAIEQWLLPQAVGATS